jgi:hypothetical protein
MIMVTIDWQQLLGWLLVGGSGLGGAVWGFLKLIPRSNSTLVPGPANSKLPNARSADAPPPLDAVLWVEDICDAMAGASAESKLGELLKGSTRDAARAARIAELEESK